MLVHDPSPGCSIGWERIKFRDDGEYYVITARIHINPGPDCHEFTITRSVKVEEAREKPEKLLVAFKHVALTMDRYRRALQEGTLDSDDIFTRQGTQSNEERTE